jgi:hypothetical protein
VANNHRPFSGPARGQAAVRKLDTREIGLAEALQIENDLVRAQTLISLTPNLAAELIPQAHAEIAKILDADLRSEALIAIAPRLPPTEIGRAVSIAIKIPAGFARANAIAALAPLFHKDLERPDRLLLQKVLLRGTFEIPGKSAKLYVLEAFVPRFAEYVFHYVFEMQQNHGLSDDDLALTFKSFAEYLKYNKNIVNLNTVEELEEIIKDPEYRNNVDSENNEDILSTPQYSFESIGPNLGTTEEDEGDVQRRKQEKQQLWEAVLEAENVPASEREVLIAKFSIEIARATRPKWDGHLQLGGELATLSAPLFLKRVHAEDIGPDGTVRTEIIRAIDPKLMQAVVLYISHRRSRGKDLGDAAGLTFILSKPSRAKPKSPRNRPRGHKIK